jgi:hypothetical protein
MAVQEGNIKISNDIYSTSMPHKDKAIKEMTTEILLTLMIKETGEKQIVNCLIDTGFSRGLICETLVVPKERLNQKTIILKTKQGNFIASGSAENNISSLPSQLIVKSLLPFRSCQLACQKIPIRS